MKVGVIDTGVWPEHPMLADNGLPPIGGVGDDTITNFNVPSFFYGGEDVEKAQGELTVKGGRGTLTTDVLDIFRKSDEDPTYPDVYMFTAADLVGNRAVENRRDPVDHQRRADDSANLRFVPAVRIRQLLVDERKIIPTHVHGRIRET